MAKLAGAAPFNEKAQIMPVEFSPARNLERVSLEWNKAQEAGWTLHYQTDKPDRPVFTDCANKQVILSAKANEFENKAVTIGAGLSHASEICRPFTAHSADEYVEKRIKAITDGLIKSFRLTPGDPATVMSREYRLMKAEYESIIAAQPAGTSAEEKAAIAGPVVADLARKKYLDPQAEKFRQEYHDIGRRNMAHQAADAAATSAAQAVYGMVYPPVYAGVLEALRLSDSK